MELLAFLVCKLPSIAFLWCLWLQYLGASQRQCASPSGKWLAFLLFLKQKRVREDQKHLKILDWRACLCRALIFQDTRWLIHTEDSFHWPQLLLMVFPCVKKLDIQKMQASLIKKKKKRLKWPVLALTAMGCCPPRHCSSLWDSPFCPLVALTSHPLNAVPNEQGSGVAAQIHPWTDPEDALSKEGSLW